MLLKRLLKIPFSVIWTRKRMTSEVMHDGRPEKIRLAGIDCPEKKQAFGQKAKPYALDLAAGELVAVEVETKDRYGRLVGEVFLPDGKSINHEMVRAGLAWHFKRYSDDITLATLEVEARKTKRGLWFDLAPVAP
jgi:endonuclease YncB( thermonuclease family)